MRFATLNDNRDRRENRSATLLTSTRLKYRGDRRVKKGFAVKGPLRDLNFGAIGAHSSVDASSLSSFCSFSSAGDVSNTATCEGVLTDDATMHLTGTCRDAQS
jgi:hypothetical protein